MEDIHRDAIQKNIILLTEEVNLENLSLVLIEDKVIEMSDIDKIKVKHHTPETQACEFYLWYRTRGPEAFTVLVNALKKIGKECVANLLLTSVLDASTSNALSPLTNPAGKEEFINIHPSESDPAIESALSEFSLTLEERASDIKVTKAICFYNGRSDEDGLYKMESNPRGHALIVNNTQFKLNSGRKRNGAEKDTLRVQTLLTDFGYRVMVRENVESTEVSEMLKEFINMFKETPVDSCFVCVMSHGHENRILMHDGREIDIFEELVTPFNNLHCEYLRKKPKIFMFQACRGDRADKGVLLDGNTDAMGYASQDSKGNELIETAIDPPREFKMQPEVRDIMLCYATVPGYTANRDPLDGSWYVQCFCKVLMDNAHNMKFLDMLNMVGREMDKIRSQDGFLQVPAYTNWGFNYDLYFNPGYFGEDTCTQSVNSS